MSQTVIKTEYLSVKDHSVSGETFKLLYNPELEMLETFPQPAPGLLPKYYQSKDYISHTDAKRNLFERTYHIIKSIALKRKLKLINSLTSEGKELLDIGCGTGDFLQIAQQNNWNVTGTEPNQDARAIANKKTNNSVFDADQLTKFHKKQFDVITLWHVLEHLTDLEEHISIINGLLKPDGALIIAVPNYKSFDAIHYNSYWAAYDVPRHLWHFSKASISKLAIKEKMIVGKICPMKFDAFYVSLLSEKYKSGSMNVFKAFLVGMQSNFKARSSGEYSSLIYHLKKS